MTTLAARRDERAQAPVPPVKGGAKDRWVRRAPLLPALIFAIVVTLAAIRGLRVFTEIFLLTNGGPNGSSEVVMTLVYKLGLERNELGVAAAGSMLLLAATVVLTLAVRAVRR